MKKIIFILLVFTSVLHAQQQQEREGTLLTTGRAASLGVEASTAFVWDIENETTGLNTKAGMLLIFDLFPASDKGLPDPDDPNTPAVRLLLKDASFTWWNSYAASGGNFVQDDFNRWQARPLILTFDTFLADIVWSNYFFRVASSTTVMRANTVSLRSIFDDVMDTDDRFYYRENLTLWRADRYNIQKLPILGNRLNRDFLDVDFRDQISGILAAGAEFERVGFSFKAASHLNGYENEDNAWVFGADAEIVPVNFLKIDISGLAAVNYNKTALNENPVSAGAMVQYQIPVTDEIIAVPYAGIDFLYKQIAEETEWELGAGIFLYTRGFDTRASYRVLDYDDIIPIGASLGMNINQDYRTNLMLSWFDPAGRNSLIKNFGGFFQIEMGLEPGGSAETIDFAVLAQFEYSIDQKITPYLRAGYKPELKAGVKTDNMIITAALGCFLTPIHFFSFDLYYSMNPVLTPEELIMNRGLLSAIFTIRM